jgi:hypothetical protein
MQHDAIQGMMGTRRLKHEVLIWSARSPAMQTFITVHGDGMSIIAIVVALKYVTPPQYNRLLEGRFDGIYAVS